MQNQIPQNWQKVKLGDVLRIKHGYAFKGEYFSDTGKYILLTPGNFSEKNGLVLKGDKEKYYVGDVPKDYILKKDDLIIAMTDLKQDAPYLGAPVFIDKDDVYLHNQRLGLIEEINKEMLDKKYLYWLFQFKDFRSKVKGSATGSTVRHTAPERIYNIELSIPIQVFIQQKIASILSAYDDLIENNNKQIKNLEGMAQAIYKEWFLHFRFPGFEKVKMVDSPLGKIPEGWRVIKVENLVERISSGKQYDNKTVKATGLVPVLDQGKSGIIGYHEDEPGVNANENNPVIVFANHTCYQRLIHFSFSAIQNVLPFIPNKANFRNIYWLHYATKDLVEFNDYKGHWPEFMSKKLLLPEDYICKEFGVIIKPMEILIFKLEKENTKLRQTRDLLLPKLMKGKIRIQ